MRLRAVTIALLGVTGLGLTALAWGWWALALPRGATLPITYLDADRQEIASAQGNNGRVQIWVPLDRIPPSVVAAVIAAEDDFVTRLLAVEQRSTERQLERVTTSLLGNVAAP